MFSKGIYFMVVKSQDCVVTSTNHDLLSSYWLLSHRTIVETKDRCERGMNPVTMTNINFWKKYCPSQQPPVLKSCLLPTELWCMPICIIDRYKILRELTLYNTALSITMNEWAFERLRGKEKKLVISTFSLIHNVYYHIKYMYRIHHLTGMRFFSPTFCIPKIS